MKHGLWEAAAATSGDQATNRQLVRLAGMKKTQSSCNVAIWKLEFYETDGMLRMEEKTYCIRNDNRFGKQHNGE